MSSQALIAVMNAELELKSGEMLVLMVLANYHHLKTQKCNPSIYTIAQRACMGITSAKKYLRSLKTKKIIDWTTENKGTEDAHNEYRLLFLPAVFYAEPKPDRSRSEVEVRTHRGQTGGDTHASTNIIHNNYKQNLTIKHLTEKTTTTTKTAEVDNTGKPRLIDIKRMEKLKKLTDMWNAQHWSKKYHPSRKVLRGDIEPNTIPAMLLNYVSESNWEQEWQQVLEEYQNSQFLQSGGDQGILNSITWLFRNSGDNLDKVLAGTYRDKTSQLYEDFKPEQKNTHEGEITDYEEPSTIEMREENGWEMLK